MSAYQFRHRRRRDELLNGPMLLAGLVAAAWSALATKSALAASAPPARSLLVVPVLLAGAAVLARGPAQRYLGFAALWTGVVGAALVAAPQLGARPAIALAAPALLLAGVLAARFPAVTMTCVVFLTGTFGSLTAFTALQVGPTVDLLLGGLWMSVIGSWALSGRRQRLNLWPGLVLVAVYLLVTVVMIATAPNLQLALHAFRASFWLMAAALLVVVAPWTAATRERIARGIVIVAGVVGAYAVFRWIAGPAAAERALALSVPEANELGGELRTIGSFTGGKQLSAWCAEAVPFCLAASLGLRRGWRAAALVAAVLCMLGLFAPNARAGFVAVSVGLLVVLALYQGSRAFRGLHLGTTAAAAAAVVLIAAGSFALTLGGSENVEQRFGRSLVDPGSDNAFVARTGKWQAALEDLEDRPLGRGLGAAGRTQIERGRFRTVASYEVDNSYLTVGIQQGLTVMALFALSLLALFAGLARRTVALRDRRSAALAIGASGSLSALLVLFMFANYIEGLPALAGWLMVGLGLAEVTRRSEAVAGTAGARPPARVAPFRMPEPAPPREEQRAVLPPPPGPTPAAAPQATRIAIVMNLPELYGGAERMLLTFLRHCDKARIEPIVVFSGRGSLERAATDIGVRTIVLPPARLRETRRTAGNVRRLARVLRAEQPALVVNWLAKAQLYGAPAAQAAGLGDRIVWWQHDFPDGRAADRVAHALPAIAIVTASRAVAAEQSRLLPPRTVMTIAPGIEPPPALDAAAVAAERERLGLPADRPVVGIVGRLLPWKGQHRFLDAIADLRQRGHDVHGLVVGGNAYDLAPGYEEHLRQRAETLGIQDAVTFAGQVADGARSLAAMNVVVNASAREPFGIVVLEAMALGVPVVAVDAAGPGEVIEHDRSGLLASDDSGRALADQIDRLLTDPDLRASLAAGGRERYASAFTAERMTARIEDVLLDLSRTRSTTG